MDEDKFRAYLKEGGRSESAVNRCIRYAREFEGYMLKTRKGIEKVDDEDLFGFVDEVETERGKSAKTHLWALMYYFEFVSQHSLKEASRSLRAERTDRRPFKIKGFRGIDLEDSQSLEEHGISDVEQMLQAGSTPSSRARLAQTTGVDEATILELVKLCDLARVPGIKGTRARLYHDAGIDTLNKLAEADAKSLRSDLIEFIDKTKFDGIAPLPKEIEYSIKKAQSLDRIVEYER
jgi:hypothetical protein